MGSGPQRPQIGRAVRRTEDRRLVTGAGGYLADLRTPGTAYLHLIRSAAAHARIAELDVEAARVLPGVVGVYTADHLPDGGDLPVYPIIAGAARTPHPPLARGLVRFVGEPVVAILAENASLAEDAAALVEVSYEPLEAVASLETAMEDGAPLNASR